MGRAIPFVAIALIVIGLAGLIIGAWFLPSYGLRQTFGYPGGMMGSWGGPMMRGWRGSAPYVNPTPVPTGRPIDREVTITARSYRFDPARVVVKVGETINFTLVNQDALAHNFVSQDGSIPYTYMPPNATQMVVWVAPEKGTYLATCTFHPGMQVQIVVE